MEPGVVITRRKTLTVLAVAPVALSCGATPSPDAGMPCGELPADLENWVAVPLSTIPALETEGAAPFDDAPSLLHVWLLRDDDGCHRAVWRICTHGACEVAPTKERTELECPCHGSRFGRDGAVHTGPATRALKVLEARRVGDVVYVKKPI